MEKPKVLVAQLGARKHYQEPALFHKWGLLDSFYTDFYAGNNYVLELLHNPQIYKFLPLFLRKGLDRYEPTLKKVHIFQFPTLAYQYAQARRTASPQERIKISVLIAKKFCQKVIQNNLDNVNVIYGFNGASLEIFEFARKQGIRCVLDQVLAERYLVHKLLLEEEDHWPGWSLSQFNISQASLELLEREQSEQELADHIVCGSSFVQESLLTRGVEKNKVSVISIGRLIEGQLLSNQFSKKQTPEERGDGLRILFAGAVGLRKGIPYLLKALQKLYKKIPFSCKVAGRFEIKSERILEYSNICDFLGLVPRSKMIELYTWADVFVLPSICEGSAMVIYEALSTGLPIITTPNAGSIIRHGIDGFIVPMRDAEALVEKLLEIYQKGLQINTTTLDHFQAVCQNSENELYKVITNL